MEEQIIEKNKKYWDDHADLWFGTTALPKYGVKFATEDDLHFFSNITSPLLSLIRLSDIMH